MTKNLPIIRTIAVLVAFCFLMASQYIFPNPWLPDLYIYTFALAPLLATAAAFYLLRTYGRESVHFTPTLFFASGFLSWFVGETIWEIFFYLNMELFPSVADLFFNLGFVFLLAGVIGELRLARVNLARFSRPTLFMLGLVTLLLSGFVVYFGVILSIDPESHWLWNLASMGPGIGDVVLIVISLLAMIMSWEYRKGKLATFWAVFIVGNAFSLVGDVLYVRFYEAYEQGNMFYVAGMDMAWIIGRIFYAFAFLYLGMAVRGVRNRIQKELAENNTSQPVKL